MATSAIPTTYADYRFRSRLEARWAAFFDLAQWRWRYEPIELGGYIPDFVLSFPRGPLLVEVKPAFTVADLGQHVARVEESGWEHDALIVGGDPRLDDDVILSVPGSSSIIGLVSQRTAFWDDWAWQPAETMVCSTCGQRSFFSPALGWFCYACDETGKVYGGGFDPDPLWAEAGNLTQWRP